MVGTGVNPGLVLDTLAVVTDDGVVSASTRCALLRVVVPARVGGVAAQNGSFPERAEFNALNQQRKGRSRWPR